MNLECEKVQGLLKDSPHEIGNLKAQVKTHTKSRELDQGQINELQRQLANTRDQVVDLQRQRSVKAEELAEAKTELRYSLGRNQIGRTSFDEPFPDARRDIKSPKSALEDL